MTMFDGSRYLKCDSCGVCLDRRPKDDYRDSGRGSRAAYGGGTYKSSTDLIERANNEGWALWHKPHRAHDVGRMDYCPACATLGLIPSHLDSWATL